MNCGCSIAETGEVTDKGPSRKVVFCPLHAAAPDMLAVLKEIRISYGFYTFVKVKKAIAKAEGK